MEDQKEYLPSTEVITKQVIDDYLYGSGTKLTDQQKALFYQVSKINGLNPFKREVYAIPYGDKFNIVTGYETYLKRAERSGKLSGWRAEVIKEGTELIGKCYIYRKDWKEPLVVEAWYSEYNQNNRMWKEKPRTMIRKVAIAQAFRMAFPEELGGMPYTQDEMPIDVTPEPVSATPETPKIDDLPQGKGKPATQSAKVKKALQWTEDHGMTADEIATALCKEIADITEADLPELKVAYGAWKAAKEAPDPTVAPCPDGSTDFPASYCGAECPRDLECEKKK